MMKQNLSANSYHRNTHGRGCSRDWPLLILLAASANAQSGGRGEQRAANRGGYCPLGTCNIHGGRMARNLANCAASNCLR